MSGFPSQGLRSCPPGQYWAGRAFSLAVLPSDPASCSRAGTGSGPCRRGDWGLQLTVPDRHSSAVSEGVGEGVGSTVTASLWVECDLQGQGGGLRAHHRASPGNSTRSPEGGLPLAGQVVRSQRPCCISSAQDGGLASSHPLHGLGLWS